MQTQTGAQKIAAQKLGIPLSEYLYQTADLCNKWCGNCQEWHPQTAFGKDSSRYDGLSATCKQSRNQKARTRYTPKERPQKGRAFVPARDNDKLQARRRINYFVGQGIIPHPNDIPCFDCGHTWAQSSKRHEYDHYLGYAAEHHEHVQAVCSACHHKRERNRINGR